MNQHEAERLVRKYGWDAVIASGVLDPLAKREKLEEEAVAARERERIANIPPVNRTAVTLTDGSPVTEDHRELKSNGQQKGYIVLSEEERRKGFVRPVRCSYVHVGPPGPKHELRDLTTEEKERYGSDWAKFEMYPASERPKTGKFWTQKELDHVGKGCYVTTTMGLALAETYSRDPGFYGGTFCCGCGKHLPVNEFVWVGTEERVGS